MNEDDDTADIVDWVLFEKNRKDLGPGFIRILSYFREDGAKSVEQIEQAMRQENTAALVLPAHTIKGESRQLGAEPLSHRDLRQERRDLISQARYLQMVAARLGAAQRLAHPVRLGQPAQAVLAPI